MKIEKQKNTSFLNNEILPIDVFTPEDFTDEHRMVENMVGKFVMNEVHPKLEKIEQQDFKETLILMEKAGELGLIAADIPSEDGGLELGKVSATIISEKMAVGRSFSITFGGQTGIGALPIAYFGSKEQKLKYLPEILSGEKIAAYALTEPSSGTDAMSLKTTALLSECGNYYLLNGEKQWITSSGFSDIFIVYAKVEGQKITAFIVEKNDEGVSTGPEEKKMGLKGSSTRSLILNNVKVPVENVIGEIGRGHIIAFNVLNIGRHKIAATSLGTAKRAIELAVKYANERLQFDQPLSNFNLIKNKIADMVIKTFANESAVYRTAGSMQNGFNKRNEFSNDYGKIISQYVMECSINKIMSTEILDFVVDEALQIHGGYGYMEEYEIETLYRDSRITRIFEGTNEINRIVIATTALKLEEDEIDGDIVIDGLLQHEQQVLQLMKKLFHATVLSMQEESLFNINVEQEAAAFLADLAIAIYAIESSILRTEKAIQKTGQKQNSLKYDCTVVYTHEISQQIGLKALNIINHLGDNELFTRTASRLIMSSSVNLVEVKRRIANTVIKAERYIS
ncbi:acyl-CoA dehydrogenase family protein [Bacillus sp. JJ1566]|uniref:acyl-CoA dehydrogenase family protein n=1 Tax=Bacillus sp. JJ1566 TaxID=3122961 RepID=UPI002FFFCA48